MTHELPRGWYLEPLPPQSARCLTCEEWATFSIKDYPGCSECLTAAGYEIPDVPPVPEIDWLAVLTASVDDCRRKRT